MDYYLARSTDPHECTAVEKYTENATGVYLQTSKFCYGIGLDAPYTLVPNPETAVIHRTMSATGQNYGTFTPNTVNGFVRLTSNHLTVYEWLIESYTALDVSVEEKGGNLYRGGSLLACYAKTGNIVNFYAHHYEDIGKLLTTLEDTYEKVYRDTLTSVPITGDAATDIDLLITSFNSEDWIKYGDFVEPEDYTGHPNDL